MHTFVWDAKNQEEILDCDLLYEEKDEDQDAGAPTAEDLESLPPFLRLQREAQLQQEHDEGPGPSLAP